MTHADVGMNTPDEPSPKPAAQAGLHRCGEDGGGRPSPSRRRELCLRLQCSEAELQDALAAVGPVEAALARHIEFVRGLTGLLRVSSGVQPRAERHPSAD